MSISYQPTIIDRSFNVSANQLPQVVAVTGENMPCNFDVLPGLKARGFFFLKTQA